jgi:uncharacterized protein
VGRAGGKTNRRAARPIQAKTRRFSRKFSRPLYPASASIHRGFALHSWLADRSPPRHNATVAFEKHLLVDGANVIHAWPALRALLPDRAAARAQLAQRLAGLHDTESVRTTIVHDGRGEELVVERPSRQETFSILYTPSALTADTVIERLVAKSADPAACVVASGDRAIRQTIEASGAAWISPDDLAAWIERAEQRQGQQLARLRKTTDRKWRDRE